jgi:hypothetical protein
MKQLAVGSLSNAWTWKPRPRPNKTAAITVDVSKTIYRLGHSDTFACHSCEKKGDKWFMQQYNCGNKLTKS